MGRTIKPVSWLTQAKLNELKKFVKALRSQDADIFEGIQAKVKKHIDAINYANPLNPGELMQWAVMLEFYKELFKLKNDVDRCLQSKR